MKRIIPVALVQFDSEPEKVGRNLERMRQLAKCAAGEGARWILFHEATTTDYTPNLQEFAQPLPHGHSASLMRDLGEELGCFLGFGLSEVDADRYYITQAFVGPGGFFHAYRKTWLWRDPEDHGFRNEWARYDPGTGPEMFAMDGVRAACMICADGEAPRCIDRVRTLEPRVVFFPNNRARLPNHEKFGAIAKHIGAPLLVTNRVGPSWEHDCLGGCVAYDGNGSVLAEANRCGREEILHVSLEF